MRQFGDRTGNCNSQHKVWRTERDGQDKGEAEGWLAWGWNILFVSLFTLCHTLSCVTRDMWRGLQMPKVPITSITHLWEEGGIFWLLKVHLLQIQQVLVSNEGNDECFCWDELACAAQGVNATVKSQKQNLPSEPKLCVPTKHLNTGKYGKVLRLEDIIS